MSVSTYAMRVHEAGGPKVLAYEEISVDAPGPGQFLVRNEAIGLNLLDVCMRSGRYSAQTPFVPGHEGAGTVVEVGSGVDDFEIGDRVGYIDPMGASAGAPARIHLPTPLIGCISRRRVP